MATLGRKTKKSVQLPDNFFPMPSAAPDQCRDKFLQDLLKSYEVTAEISTSSKESTETITSIQMPFDYNIFNTEERLMDDFLRFQRRSMYSQKSTVDESGINAPHIFTLLKERYDNIANAVGFLAVLFELSEVKNRIAAVRQSWRMETNADRSLHMFSWSIKHFFARFNLRSQTYLDNFEFALKGQMECFKFRTGLKEIIRLIEAVTEDYKTRRDICANSMMLIKDAEIDIMELLTNSHKDIEMQSKQLAKTVQETPWSADPQRKRYKALQTKINNLDFLAPVEARYQLNWAQDTIEQSLMHDDYGLKELSDEVEFFKEQNFELRGLWNLSSLAYSREIHDLKMRIHEIEEAYEVDMERADDQIQVTTSKLHKAKDDLSFFMEKIPFFHSRIAEVLAILDNTEP